MMVELPIYKPGGNQRQTLAIRTIRRVEPDRNWTRITLDNNEQVLAAISYREATQAIADAIK
jgi:hypothetical protein